MGERWALPCCGLSSLIPRTGHTERDALWPLAVHILSLGREGRTPVSLGRLPCSVRREGLRGLALQLLPGSPSPRSAPTTVLGALCWLIASHVHKRGGEKVRPFPTFALCFCLATRDEDHLRLPSGHRECL